MDKATKQELVTDYNGIFQSAQVGVVVDFKGMTVDELTKLRKSLYEKGSRFRVLKNTLAKRGADGTPFEGIKDQFVKTRALVYSDEDIVSAAKIMSTEAKANEKLSIVGGLLVNNGEGEVLDEAGIIALGSLPSKEELIAKVLFVLNAPITNFVRTLNEVPASFVRVLQAAADKGE